MKEKPDIKRCRLYNVHIFLQQTLLYLTLLLLLLLLLSEKVVTIACTIFNMHSHCHDV